MSDEAVQSLQNRMNELAAEARAVHPRKTLDSAKSLWDIAAELGDELADGKVPDADKTAVLALALAVVASDVEKKDARIKAVLDLCSRAEAEGAAGSASFTMLDVGAVRRAAESD